MFKDPEEIQIIKTDRIIETGSYDKYPAFFKALIFMKIKSHHPGKLKEFIEFETEKLWNFTIDLEKNVSEGLIDQNEKEIIFDCVEVFKIFEKEIETIKKSEIKEVRKSEMEIQGDLTELLLQPVEQMQLPLNEDHQLEAEHQIQALVQMHGGHQQTQLLVPNEQNVAHLIIQNQPEENPRQTLDSTQTFIRNFCCGFFSRNADYAIYRRLFFPVILLFLFLCTYFKLKEESKSQWVLFMTFVFPPLSELYVLIHKNWFERQLPN